ncbi:MAG: universal stress protein [Hyphomonadaceae bacterium]|nr:universal stress protein [Hyphomonadaceae bacterium]
MTYKDVLAPVIALDEDEPALAAAAEIAAKFEAHATALIIAVHLASEFEPKPRALSEVLADITAGSQSHAALLAQGLRAWIARAPYPFETREATIEDAVRYDHILAHARVSDLVVLAQSSGHDRARRALAEDILLRSGRPLLLVPAGKPKARKWSRVAIGWDAKATAVRAISAAMPLLRSAEHVSVVTVDAKPSGAGHAPAPGHDLALHLARHGVHVDVRNVASGGHSDSKALLEEAVAVDADVLVLGAYGHARAQEFVFGGVTRDLLATSPLPLLMMH